MCFFTTHKHTISRSINLRARVLSVSMAFTPHSICLPPSLSPSLSQSQSVALSQFVFFFAKRGWGRCITRISRTLCRFSFLFLFWCFFYILTMLVVVVNQLPNCILYIIFTRRKSQKRCAHSAQSQSCRNTKHNTQFYAIVVLY